MTAVLWVIIVILAAYSMIISQLVIQDIRLCSGITGCVGCRKGQTVLFNGHLITLSFR